MSPNTEIYLNLKTVKNFNQVTEYQIIQFVNIIYSVDDSGNLEIYIKKPTTTKYIFELVKENLTVFSSKILLAFTRWCSNSSLKILNVKEDRNHGIRQRNIFVMDEIYYDCVRFIDTEVR
ncbi:hypothetical protein K501DRAFT_277165 [Backusella circina FSU 941]|nr:hypothetical protein K501DRAFT_277165 [Backusella circina FSU 941]